MRSERGVTVIELVVVLAVLALGVGVVASIFASALSTLRVHGATTDLYAAIHRTRARARAAGLMHALVLEDDGRGFHIVEDPAGQNRTVVGPEPLVDGVVATGNVTLRFSPKGFAVPFGTITVSSGPDAQRLIVNILGRVRIAPG